MRRYFKQGTWLDPEERAGPNGTLYGGRKARVKMPSGIIRTVNVGIPDTFSTIPAVTQKAPRKRGYVTIEDGVLRFHYEARN